MWKGTISTILNLEVWLTEVLANFVGGVWMIVSNNNGIQILFIPYIPDIITIIAALIVVILTLVSVILAIINRAK